MLLCHWDGNNIKEADGYETKAQTLWHSLFVSQCRSTLYLVLECLSRRHSADLTCLSFVTVSNPGPSDGPENGCGHAGPYGAVSPQAGADVPALHPQGDHPETHGCQHRWGALMSQGKSRGVWWHHHQRKIKRTGVHINSPDLYMGPAPIFHLRSQNFLIDFRPLRREQLLIVWDMRARAPLRVGLMMQKESWLTSFFWGLLAPFGTSFFLFACQKCSFLLYTSIVGLQSFPQQHHSSSSMLRELISLTLAP